MGIRRADPNIFLRDWPVPTTTSLWHSIAMPQRLPPLHAWSSALIATVVGFGGTIALVVQAMRALGASVEQTGSAVTALCLGFAFGGCRGPEVRRCRQTGNTAGGTGWGAGGAARHSRVF